MAEAERPRWWSGPSEPASPSSGLSHPGSGVEPHTATSAKGGASPGGVEAPAEGALPTVALPKGGGAIRGIDEKLSVSEATGTASLSVEVFTSATRQSSGPTVTLAYDSGAGNGPFGLGWRLSVPSIARKTASRAAALRRRR